MTDERIDELWALAKNSADWPVHRPFARLIAVETAKPLVEAMKTEADGEINPINYDHEDVCRLNSKYLRLLDAIDAALAEHEKRMGKPACATCGGTGRVGAQPTIYITDDEEEIARAFRMAGTIDCPACAGGRK